MRLASIVLAHRLPEQLARLVARLVHDDDVVLVHVDAKQDLGPFTVALGTLLDGERVRLLPRTRCEWGGWGLVQATLDGLAAALEGPRPADRVSLLSGQDYPLLARDAIAARLAGDAAYLDHRPWPEDGLADSGGMDRIERLYLRPSRRWSLPNRWMPLWPKRRLPDGLRPYGGSQFWSLPADVAQAVLDVTRERPEVVRFYRRTFVPDEHVVQTLVLSGPLAHRAVADDLRFTVFDRHRDTHPQVLTTADLPALLAADALFARKFDGEVDTAVLDALDRERLSVR